MDLWWQQPAVVSVAVLLSAVLSDALWRWPRASHPLTLVRFLAEAMAGKVRPSSSTSARQHRISGSLGALLLVLPLAIVLANLIALAYYPWFFEALILLAMLDFGHDRKHYRQLVGALKANKKLLARDRLALLVARDTQRLSDIGIAKAAIEALLLRFYAIYCGVIVWYLIAGPIGALSYRFLLAICWQWHDRRPGFYHFNRPVRTLIKLLMWPPRLLGMLCIAISTNPLSAWRGLRQCPAKDSGARILAMFGRAMGIELGGPAIYHSQTIRYPRVGGARAVRFSDLVYVYRAIMRAAIVLVCLASLLLLVPLL